MSAEEIAAGRGALGVNLFVVFVLSINATPLKYVLNMCARYVMFAGEVRLSSTYKGVFFDKRSQKWRAMGYFGGGKRLQMGSHSTEIEAAKAYDKGMRHLLDKELNFRELA